MMQNSLFYTKKIYQEKVYPYWKFNAFNLDEVDETDCKVEFRFAKADLFLLLRALRFPGSSALVTVSAFLSLGQ